MKTRTGFVSNSSSSSFVISLDNITDVQLEKIENHIHFAQDMRNIHYSEEDDAWDINVDKEKNVVRGNTFMDSFSMPTFLGNIGVPADVVKWDEGGWDW